MPRQHSCVCMTGQGALSHVMLEGLSMQVIFMLFASHGIEIKDELNHEISDHAGVGLGTLA